MKVLITGDSFAADWQVKYPGQFGWPNLITDIHDVTNIARAGCSEYRIYKQLTSVNLEIYDVVIVSHTSPYRIYTDYHPARRNDVLHSECDLLYTDIEELSKHNYEYQTVLKYFEKFFSLEYAEFSYYQTIHAINQLLTNTQTIQLTHLLPIPGCLDFSNLFKTHKGHMNHYNEQANQLICDRILKEIK